MFGLPGLLDFLGGAFSAAAGWAWSTVTDGILDWVVRGVVSMITAIWQFLDATAEPDLTASWFSAGASSPVGNAFAIGGAVLALAFTAAVIRGVATGSPGALLRLVGHDLPVAVLAMGATVAVADVLIRWADQTSDWVWERTREDTVAALDRMAAAMMSGLGPMGILGPLVGILTLLSMFLLWIVLLVRGALIPIVVVFAIAFVLPASLLPAMRDATKTTGQMLVALIISKPLITIALTIGLSALGGSEASPDVASPPVVTELAPGPDGSTGSTQPTAFQTGFSSAVVAAPAVDSTASQQQVSSDGIASTLSVLFIGLVTIGLASFMPFLVWKLLPLAAGALVAQGVASGPLRATSQTMQFSYYGSMMRNRLAGGAARQSSAAAATGSGTAGGAVAGSAAAGPAAPVVAATVAAGQAAAGAARSSAQQTAAHAGGAAATTDHDG